IPSGPSAVPLDLPHGIPYGPPEKPIRGPSCSPLDLKGPGAFDTCQEEHCAELPCLFIRPEYLLWWTHHTRLPLLVTTGAFADVVPGAFGQRGTLPAFGGTTVDPWPFNGLRLTGDFWMDDSLALQLSGFVLEQRSVRYNASSDGTVGAPIISRPFFN